MLIVTGTLTVAPADLAEFYTDLRPLATMVRLRDGNLSYNTTVLVGDNGQLLVVERWRDQAALSAHLRSEEVTAFVAKWQARSQGDVRVYDACNERPLAAL